MTDVDRSPSRVAAATASLFALLAAIAGGAFAWSAAGLGAVGVGLVLLGLVLASRRTATAGAGALVGCGLFAGFHGAPVAAVIVCVTAAVLSWDASSTALSLGRQLGREAETRRVELVHVAASTAVGVGTVALGYLVHRATFGGRSPSALVFLLLATVLLVAVVRSYRVDVADFG